MEKIGVQKKSYRRRQFFIKKEFQLRYIGLILAVMLFGAAVSGYTIYYNSWMLLGSKLANVYPQGRLVNIFNMVNIRLAISMFFVAMLCIGVGILASHRIAGPVYRMIKFLEELTKGDYTKRVILRKTDELQDLAAAINKLVEKLESEKKS